ncbi:unnamed protein product [Symbiodinium natans]|uniref:Uncharacterized protein n=1 Tax=Symbiodinium natans TaxID=878477 RepID=A0A812TXK8_9DINO|nr:unnamed protein product [Symbiodinium natans]
MDLWLLYLLQHEFRARRALQERLSCLASKDHAITLVKENRNLLALVKLSAILACCPSGSALAPKFRLEFLGRSCTRDFGTKGRRPSQSRCLQQQCVAQLRLNLPSAESSATATFSNQFCSR